MSQPGSPLSGVTMMAVRTPGHVGSFPDEASAWSAAVGGDPEAFADVFDRHLQRVFSHAVRLIGDRHDAEDLTAGAFLELWRRRGHVRVVEGSVLPWLLVTVQNLARNRVRGLRRYRRLLAALPRSDTTPTAEQAAVEQVTAEVRSGRLQDALHQLSTTDATLIALTTFGGLPVHQAAATLGLSPGAASTRLHRARVRMRAELADLEGEGPPTAEKESRG